MHTRHKSSIERYNELPPRQLLEKILQRARSTGCRAAAPLLPVNIMQARGTTPQGSMMDLHVIFHLCGRAGRRLGQEGRVMRSKQGVLKWSGEGRRAQEKRGEVRLGSRQEPCDVVVSVDRSVDDL